MNDQSNSAGNFLFLSGPTDQEDQEQINPVEIGREEIRIPISISAATQKTIEKKTGRTVISSAVCPITGISVAILVPDLPIEFDYENPIGKYRNAMKIAQLSDFQRKALSNEVLAGTILSLLDHAGLIEKGFSYRAYESNRIIAEGIALTETLMAVKKIVEHNKKELPQIHFVQGVDFPEYIKTITEIAFPAKPVLQHEQKEPKITTVKVKVEPGTKIPFKTAMSIKRHTKFLLTSEIISKKAAEIFLWLLEGSNIESLTKEQKSKYIMYLTEKGDPDADSLAIILSSLKYSKGISLEDEIIPDVKPTLSFLEMLAQRKGKQND